MSNSRKIKRSVKRNVTAVSMAALGTVTVGGVLVATAGTAFASTPTASSAAAVSTTTVYPGSSAQAAGDVTLTTTNNFTTGDTITIPITTATGTFTTTVGQTGTVAASVAFNATPTVTVSANTATETTNGDTPPTVTETLKTNPNDSAANIAAGTKDELVISIGNTATGHPADTYTFTISGITYNVGGGAAGSVQVDPIYNANSGASGSTSTVMNGGTSVTNATIQPFQITETPTGIPENSTAQALSNMVLKEVDPGSFAGAGAIYTITPTHGAFTGTATVTATGFTVQPVVSGACSGTAGSSATMPVTTSGTYQFCVANQTTATTGPGTLSVSGMTFTPAASYVGTATVQVASAGGTAGTTTGPYSTAPVNAITVVNNPTVAGYTADDTAAASAAQAVSAAGGPSAGVGSAVVLASDAEYQDALSASYLVHSNLPAQGINGASITGGSNLNPLLLNPYDSTNEAATPAAQEIRKLGAGTVYIIGGIDAISQDVQNQLSKIQIGTNSAGLPVYLQVIRIAGTTAEQTASMVAQYTAAGAPALTNTPGAYGMYNSGASESTTPPTGATVKTAILADANEFQDALSASPLASGKSVPVLLTAGGQNLDPAAATALVNLGVKQVIVVGGSAAVSDAAATSVENLGISVLRIAGTTFDATSNLLAQFEVNNAASGGTATVPTSLIGLNSLADAGITGVAGANTLTVGTSRGDAYQDALSSSNLLGATGGPSGVVDPLLLNSGTSTISTGASTFLTAHGPNAGFSTYTTVGAATPEGIAGDIVFGGTLAQTPALVQSELNAIAGA